MKQLPLVYLYRTARLDLRSMRSPVLEPKQASELFSKDMGKAHPQDPPGVARLGLHNHTHAPPGIHKNGASSCLRVVVG